MPLTRLSNFLLLTELVFKPLLALTYVGEKNTGISDPFSQVTRDACIVK